jgi:hypothetical protein
MMKGTKLVLTALCAFVTVVAAVTAIVIFRNEIAYFFTDIKDKIDEKRVRRNGEYADYADM